MMMMEGEAEDDDDDEDEDSATVSNVYCSQISLSTLRVAASQDDDFLAPTLSAPLTWRKFVINAVGVHQVSKVPTMFTLRVSASQEDDFLAPTFHVHHLMWRKLVVDAVGVQQVSVGGLGLEEGYQGEEGSAEPEHHGGGGGGRAEPSGICVW